MHILEQNPDKIYWEYLSLNPNPNAIQLLKQKLDKITPTEKKNETKT